MNCGPFIGREPRNREQERAIARLNRNIRADNVNIARGNQRRRFCVEKILEWCMKRDEVQARVWVTKLVSAGFNKSDGATYEAMSLSALEAECRGLLGLEAKAP